MNEKNYSLKLKLKRLFFFVVFAGCLSTLSSLDFSFSFEPFWSIQGGSVREFVWAKKDGVFDYKLSELLWDVKPLWAGGVRASAVLEGFELAGSFAFGLTGKSGSVQDSDWLNNNYSKPYDSYKTHYSKSDNSLNNYMNANGSFGYNFKLPKNWTLTPLLSFVYRSFGFDAKDGTYDYPVGRSSGVNLPYTEVGSGVDREQGAFTGKVISYEQYVQYFSLGAKAAWTFKGKWKFGGTLSFIPLIFATGYDNHWKTSTNYIDIMYGGLGVSGELNASFVLDKTVVFTAGFNMEYIGNLKGPSFSAPNSSGDSYINQLQDARKNPIHALYLTNKGIKAGTLSAVDVLGGAGQYILGGYLSVTISF